MPPPLNKHPNATLSQHLCHISCLLERDSLSNLNCSLEGESDIFLLYIWLGLCLFLLERGEFLMPDGKLGHLREFVLELVCLQVDGLLLATQCNNTTSAAVSGQWGRGEGGVVCLLLHQTH